MQIASGIENRAFSNESNIVVLDAVPSCVCVTARFNSAADAFAESAFEAFCTIELWHVNAT